ncbi:PDZ domain-containing protein [Lactobacillus sp. DCY120]|uniref:PDZ domain-containing protein n=1 Tax=Bombilactobacillus apium TaxID=2675299 RepID=A0A850QYH1_9LACO|nr:SepM family pheromone-processing serine protease [Bombilactobacillus apium]NVY95713.1 PDZ domain-containing protein [Bombilactobacillus apium]
MMKKKTSKILGLVVLVVVLLGICLWPWSGVIEAPGTADAVSSVVKVKKHGPHDSGRFLFTTVTLKRLNLLTWLQARNNPFQTQQTQKEIMGHNTRQEYTQVQSFWMDSSLQNATIAAFKEAHHKYRRKYVGAYVTDVLPQSHFFKKLRVGDNLIALNGQKIHSVQGAIGYLKKQPQDKKIKVTYRRDKQRHIVYEKLTFLKTQKRFGLGLSLADNFKMKTKPDVLMEAGNIGGPSAGLMFALQVYQQVSSHNLTQQRLIAGTGTIDPQGQVGPVGGIEKKVYAAWQQRAKIFFTPAPQAQEKKTETNYYQAQKAAQKLQASMKIVPVHNLNEAINYLETHH